MQQSDKSDEIGDESVDFSDLNKMFGFMIEKTASRVKPLSCFKEHCLFNLKTMACFTKPETTSRF
jgi:hypothetical protein